MIDRPSRLRPYRKLVFWLALALLVGVGAASVFGVRSLQRSNEAIEHSYQSVHRIETVERDLRTVESNARAYRLSGDEGHRESYLQARARLDVSMQLLAQHAAADRERVEQLRTQVGVRLEEMHRLYTLQEHSGIESAQLAGNPAAALAHWERIDALGRQLLDDEHRRLAERQSASRRHSRGLIGFVVLGMLLSTGLLIALTTSINAEMRRARRLEREAREAVRALQASSAQRDRLSEQRRELSLYSSMLQSCGNRDEIMQLTAATIRKLLPGASGQCYVLRASQDFLESAAAFGDHVISSGDLLLPDQCWALRRGREHLVDGRAEGGLRCAHIDPEAAHEGISSLCLPLSAQGSAIGLLHVSAPAGDPKDGDEAIIASVAEQLGLALANTQLRETLRMQSLRDPLTGLFNRRYLAENLARELHRCERRGLPLSLLMLDVDHFKRFNDTHGHAAGDALLAQVGRIIAANIRAEDMACRYGGEEFTVVLPETDAATAFERAQAIRTALESATLLHLRQTLGPVTASFGVSTYPADGTTPELLLQVADAWLYRAKAEGRNRVQPEPAAG